MSESPPAQHELWSMCPFKHPEVSTLLEREHLHFTFRIEGDDKACAREYDTHIMGRFRCENPECDNQGWSSKPIAITIRMYPDDEYNAGVYHQHCIACDTLSTPTLDDSYAGRVAYRLKKWRGIKLKRRSHPKTTPDKPHEGELCKGCKAGHCGSNDPYSLDEGGILPLPLFPSHLSETSYPILPLQG
ncbi:zinc-binding domain-containing protein [Xylaria acuta]|nr:zinc-binding domain-containing protein [Xylaria acuta]